jgi:isoamylase
MKSVVVDPSRYDWEGDVPPRRPAARTIIYEMHVRGFTRHPAGLGASHQTGWTGLVATLIQLFGRLDGPQLLEVGRAAAFASAPGSA